MSSSSSLRWTQTKVYKDLEARIWARTTDLNRLRNKWPHEKSDEWPHETIQEIQEKLALDIQCLEFLHRRMYTNIH